MQTVTEAFEALWAGSHRAWSRADVYDTTGTTLIHSYGENAIRSIKTEGALFAGDQYSFGGCISRQFEMSFYPGSYTIPRMAQVRLFMTLTDGTAPDSSAEWIPKGVFFVDTRQTDHNGLMTVRGYDAMLKAEQLYVPEWTVLPKKGAAVANEIAQAITGRAFVDKSYFSNDYDVPVLTNYSMREVLSFIAAIEGGNFIITDGGLLRLVEPNYQSRNFSATNADFMSFERGATYSKISKVTVHVSDITTLTAGDDTGRAIELTCPFATQDDVDTLKVKLGAYGAYTPYRASALLHPAAEPGDTITYGAVSYYVASQTTYFNALFASDLEAPGEDEIDHEYSFSAPSGRAIDRKIATVRSEVSALNTTVSTLSVTVDGISAEVEDLSGDVAEVELTVGELNTRVEDAEGNITTLQQTTTEIRGEVNNKAGKTDGTLGPNSFSYSLTSTGFSLSSDGQTVMAVNASGATFSGLLVVHDGTDSQNTVFEADAINHIVQIGGFNVNKDALFIGSSLSATNSVFLCDGNSGSITVSGHTATDWVLKAGSSFGVRKGGQLYAASGKIGNWSIDVEKLYYGTIPYYNNPFSAGSAMLFPEGSPTFYKVAGQSHNNFVMIFGPNFGVQKDGTLYASNVHLTGEITATSGSIGSFVVNSNGSIEVNSTQGVNWITVRNTSATSVVRETCVSTGTVFISKTGGARVQMDCTETMPNVSMRFNSTSGLAQMRLYTANHLQFTGVSNIIFTGVNFGMHDGTTCYYGLTGKTQINSTRWARFINGLLVETASTAGSDWGDDLTDGNAHSNIKTV